MTALSQQKQYLVLVDEKGIVRGKEEKWAVHQKGVLHKGFSIALFHGGSIILQKRKHPVFDKVTDFTASSHPVMINGRPQDEEEAVLECLRREWSVNLKSGGLKALGSFVYRAQDKSGFIEHEFCTIYQGHIDFLPLPHPHFAYGFELVEFSFLKDNQDRFPLAPWVKEALSILHFGHRC